MTSVQGVLETLASAQDGLITARQCAGAGMSPGAIGRLVRSRHWQGVFRGVYATRPGPLTDRQRVRGALLAVGPAGVAVLTSAGTLHGWPVLPADPAVQVSLPAALRRRDQPGLVARQLVLGETDVTTVHGLSVTTPARTAADLALRLPRLEAVGMLDAALRGDSLTAADVETALCLIYGNRGAVRARQSLLSADSRAQSPLETRVRLICADGGVPPEELQFPVYDEYGVLIAVADLAWPSRRLLVEADGRLVHSSPAALLHDRRRQNELTARGFTVVRFTWADTTRPAYIVGVVRRALGLA